VPARRARVRVERTHHKRYPHAHERSHIGDASARASASAMVTARATVS
jgi:hypothetical protein